MLKQARRNPRSPTPFKVSNFIQVSNKTQSSTTTKSDGWSGVHHQLYQQESMKKWILLDNKSIVTIFCNLDMVQDIQETKNKSLNLVTNARVLRTTKKANIPE